MNEIKVCKSCWEEDCICDYEEYIYIDEKLFDIIVDMNIKGYKTHCCCEGHILYDDGDTKSKVFDMYIVCEDRFDELPLGFSYPRGKKHTDFHHKYLYKYMNGNLMVKKDTKYIDYDLELDKEQHLLSLRAWVNQLTPRNPKDHPSNFSFYLRTGKPCEKMIYEVPETRLYTVEIEPEFFEKTANEIVKWCGKIEEINDIGNVMKIIYRARDKII